MRPLTFSIGTGNTGPHIWPQLPQDLAKANADGVMVKGEVMLLPSA